MEELPNTPLSDKPMDALSYLERGNANVKRVRLGRALADYDMAIQLDPTLAEAYFLRGKLYAQEGRLNRGIADYNTAIQLNPKFAQAYFLRGKIHIRQDSDDDAIADYSMAIQLDPTIEEAYMERADAYQRQGNFDGAIADYGRVIEGNPQRAEFWYSERALLYEWKGELELAIADYSAAIKISTEYEVYFVRGNCHFKLGNLEDAIADYDTAIRLGRTSRAVYNNRGIALSIQGQFERAASDFENVVDQILKLKELRRTGLVREFGGFDMLEPNNVTAYSIRGGIFLAKGAAKEALSDFQAGLKLEPANLSLLAGRAISLHSAYQISEAVAAWQWLVELDERYRDAEWVGKKLGWISELIEEARKVIAAI